MLLFDPPFLSLFSFFVYQIPKGRRGKAEGLHAVGPLWTRAGGQEGDCRWSDTLSQSLHCHTVALAAIRRLWLLRCFWLNKNNKSIACLTGCDWPAIKRLTNVLAATPPNRVRITMETFAPSARITLLDSNSAFSRHTGYHTSTTMQIAEGYHDLYKPTVRTQLTLQCITATLNWDTTMTAQHGFDCTNVQHTHTCRQQQLSFPPGIKKKNSYICNNKIRYTVYIYIYLKI